MLTRVAQDAERALRSVERAPGWLEDEALRDAHQLLRHELIGQDFDIDESGIRGCIPGRLGIISTVDTEMRHGRKSAQQRFDGYKLSAAATNTRVPADHCRRCCARQRTGRAAPRSSSISSPLPADRGRCLATPPTATGQCAPSWPSATSTCSPRPRGQGHRGPPRQTRLRLRSRGRHGHLPGRPDGHDQHLHDRVPNRQLPKPNVRWLPAEGLLLPWPRAPPDQLDRTRRPADRRPPSARRSRHSRASAPHSTTHRAPPRPARGPLRRPQEPLHRPAQSTATSQLDRGRGQPQPDRPPAEHANHLRGLKPRSPTSRITDRAIAPRALLDAPGTDLDTNPAPQPRERPTLRRPLFQEPF